MSKALLIKSYTTLTTGTQGNWNDLNMASSYIQGIQTGKILEDVSADKIGLYRYCPWMRGMATSQISCNNGIDKKASHVPL